MAIAEVIKYEGDNSTFVWKHPSEDFNSLTQLIVHESQEAIFFMNGQALDLFGPGQIHAANAEYPEDREIFAPRGRRSIAISLRGLFRQQNRADVDQMGHGQQSAIH